jgi:hypothetical protein
MRRTAGLHHDGCGFLLSHEFRDLRTRQPMGFGNVAGMVGNANFKDRFCQINSDGCILHDWIPPVIIFDRMIVMTLALGCRSSHQEESISSSARVWRLRAIF